MFTYVLKNDAPQTVEHQTIEQNFRKNQRLLSFVLIVLKSLNIEVTN